MRLVAAPALAVLLTVLCRRLITVAGKSAARYTNARSHAYALSNIYAQSVLAAFPRHCRCFIRCEAGGQALQPSAETGRS
jgi:hypothetical protein